MADMNVVMVGAGNLATHLAKALYASGYNIAQVYSRTEASAKELAMQVEADYTTSIEQLNAEAATYICALKDDALLQLIPCLAKVNPNALWLHTAGSIPMQVWEGHAERYGVIYPLQTFSKHREVDFKQIPLFVEVKHEGDEAIIDYMAHRLTDKVYRATSEQRKHLHLAAVFACNFTNHMYALAEELLTKWGMPFEALLPLIDETAHKAHYMKPKQAQTGPAVRGDKEVMDKHLQMLTDIPHLQRIYKQISESIATLNDNHPNNF